MDKTKKRKIENRLAETFEKAIKDLQKEGFLKEAKSFDLNFTGKNVNIRLNEAILKEDEKSEPFMWLLFDYEYLFDDFDSLYDINSWGSDTGSFYDEVCDSCDNADYDDVKEWCNDLPPELCKSDVYDIIKENNGENLLKEKFGSLEALRKCVEAAGNGDDEKQAEITAFFEQFIDDVEEWKNEKYQEAMNEAIERVNHYMADRDEDDDYDDDDEYYEDDEDSGYYEDGDD